MVNLLRPIVIKGTGFYRPLSLNLSFNVFIVFVLIIELFHNYLYAIGTTLLHKVRSYNKINC